MEIKDLVCRSRTAGGMVIPPALCPAKGGTMHKFPDETAHLAAVLQKLDTALQEASLDVERLTWNIKRQTLYGTVPGRTGSHEMFQNELLLKQTDHKGTIAAASRDKLVRLKDSPYFARIDFKRKWESMNVYIGRFTFRFGDEMPSMTGVPPVSGMFYDYETGPAAMSPTGRIDGI